MDFCRFAPSVYRPPEALPSFSSSVQTNQRLVPDGVVWTADHLRFSTGDLHLEVGNTFQFGSSPPTERLQFRTSARRRRRVRPDFPASRSGR